MLPAQSSWIGTSLPPEEAWHPAHTELPPASTVSDVPGWVPGRKISARETLSEVPSRSTHAAISAALSQTEPRPPTPGVGERMMARHFFRDDFAALSFL